MSVVIIPTPERDARLALVTDFDGTGDSPPTSPVLVLHGDVEESTVQLLIDSMSAMIEWSVGDVVVDLSEVEFIDIASVRVLDVARQLLSREGRRLSIRSPSSLAALVLGLFGLTQIIEPSQDANDESQTAKSVIYENAEQPRYID